MQLIVSCICMATYCTVLNISGQSSMLWLLTNTCSCFSLWPLPNTLKRMLFANCPCVCSVEPVINLYVMAVPRCWLLSELYRNQHRQANMPWLFAAHYPWWPKPGPMSSVQLHPELCCGGDHCARKNWIMTLRRWGMDVCMRHSQVLFCFFFSRLEMKNGPLQMPFKS